MGDALGRLLGYPECCRGSSTRSGRDADTPTPLALATAPARIASGPGRDRGRRRSPAATSCPLARTAAGFDLPCRFDCDATRDWADGLAAFWRETGRVEELRWLDEMLRWPVEGRPAGIAEMKTPVVKISART